LSTLALGEHYLVDLVAAVPFVVALQALCTTGLSWENRARRNAMLWGFGLTLSWCFVLRYGLAPFVSVPGLSWAAVLATVAGSVLLYRRLARATVARLAAEPLRPEIAPALPAVRSEIA